VSSNPIYALFSTPKSFGPFVLRMVLAAIFVFHGGQKAFGLFGGPGWRQTISNMSSPEALGLPVGVAMFVILIEVGAAIGFFFGFLTRLWGLGIVGVMIGAIATVHWKDGFTGFEFPLAVLAMALALVFLGGGRFSMDRGISSQLLPVVG